jgi:hypothetical protein
MDMNRFTTIVIGALVVATAGLAVALAVVLASDDDDGSARMTGMMDGASDDHFAGLMQAMGQMNSDEMLDHTRQVLGDDGYERMLAHFADHRDGGMMTGSSAVDEMMHSMMDGMMQHMPADGGGLMPPGSDEHHEMMPAR